MSASTAIPSVTVQYAQDGRPTKSNALRMRPMQERTCDLVLGVDEQHIRHDFERKAIAVIQSLGDDVTIDEVIDRLYFLRKVEIGLALADAGEVQDHETFFDELAREDET